jgi:toxin HigB-1
MKPMRPTRSAFAEAMGAGRQPSVRGWADIGFRTERLISTLSCCQLYPRVVHRYNSDGGRVIVSFRDDWLRAFFVEDARSRRIPPGLETRLFRKLQMIDDAATDQDLRAPPSNRFEKLRGNLAGFWSIRVNDQWRLVFRWDGGRGEAKDVYLDDHSYR